MSFTERERERERERESSMLTWGVFSLALPSVLSLSIVTIPAVTGTSMFTNTCYRSFYYPLLMINQQTLPLT